MTHTEEMIGFLQKVPLFRNLKKSDLELLAKRFVERKYAPGQAIVTQGRGGEGFFVILSGKAEARRQVADGSEVVVNTFGPTDFFGELALLGEEPRTATVVATTETTCLVLTRWDFLGELRQHADISITLLQELARRFRVVLDV